MLCVQFKTEVMTQMKKQSKPQIMSNAVKQTYEWWIYYAQHVVVCGQHVSACSFCLHTVHVQPETYRGHRPHTNY